MQRWPLGVALELLSTVFGTIGKQMVRFAEIRKKQGRLRASKSYMVSGLVLNTVVGPILDVSAYAFAPQSLLAPFGGMDVVWNTLIAPWTLNETVTPRRLLSVMLIFTATLVSVFPADHVDNPLPVEAFQDLLLSWRTAIYFVCFAAWMALNFFYLMRFPRGGAVRGFALGATAGSIAGNLFCVKALSELIGTTISEGFEEWTHWGAYAALFGAIFFSVSNVSFMTKGLQENEALFMVPVYEGTMVVTNSLTAIVVLGELDSKPTWRLVQYIVCIAVIALAMRLLISDAGGAKADVEDDDFNQCQAAASSDEEEGDDEEFSETEELRSSVISPSIVSS